MISKKQYLKIKRAAVGCWQFTQTKEPFVAFKILEIEYSLINLKGNLPGFMETKFKPDGHYSPHVYINKRYGKYSQRIIASHELGHVILHKNDYMNMLDEDDKISIKEYEANIFAMEYMPQIQPENYLALSPDELQEYIFSKLYLN